MLGINKISLKYTRSALLAKNILQFLFCSSQCIHFVHHSVFIVLQQKTQINYNYHCIYCRGLKYFKARTVTGSKTLLQNKVTQGEYILNLKEAVS